MKLGTVGIDNNGNLWYDKAFDSNVELAIEGGNLVATYDDDVVGDLRINANGELEVENGG